MHRRKLLQTAGIGIAGLSGASGVASADDDKDIETFGPLNPETTTDREIEQRAREILQARYGPKEGAVVFSVGKRYTRLVSRGELTEAEAFEEALSELEAHPNVENADDDLIEAEEMRSDLIVEDDGDSRADGGRASSVGAQTSVNISRGTERLSTSGAAIGSTRADSDERNMGAYVQSLMLGTGSARARLFGRITPDSDIAGNTLIETQYYRLGATFTGDAQISLFVRETDRISETFVRQVIERPSNVNGSTTTRRAPFFLKRGVRYDVGVEVISSVSSSIFDRLGFADYATPTPGGERRVELLRNLRIESLD